MDPVWWWLSTVVPGVCWALFVLVWLAGALYNRRRGPGTRERAGLPGAWVLVVLADVVIARLIPDRVWEPVTFRSLGLIGAGAVLLVASTAFTLWARAALGLMWTSAPVIKDDHVLRTTGPYAVTRHPIYTGITGMLAGTACVSGLGRWLAFVAVAMVLLTVKLRAEERLLRETFGEQYLRYRECVPALVPRPKAFSRSGTATG